MIDEKLKTELLAMYDKNHEYELNERFSTKGWQMVFTKPDDKYHWLVFKKKSADQIEVNQTDSTGFITDRDVYAISGDKLKLVSSESYKKDKSKVSIRERIERFKLIAQEKQEKKTADLGRGGHHHEI